MAQGYARYCLALHLGGCHTCGLGPLGANGGGGMGKVHLHIHVHRPTAQIVIVPWGPRVLGAIPFLCV